MIYASSSPPYTAVIFDLILQRYTISPYRIAVNIATNISRIPTHIKPLARINVEIQNRTKTANPQLRKDLSIAIFLEVGVW
jgi:hypothetical protein